MDQAPGISSPSRRRFLIAGATAALLTGCSSALAGRTAPPPTAPPADPNQAGTGREAVFLNYTQKELDDAYDQAIWVDNSEQLIASYGADSARVRGYLHAQTVAYGPSGAEKMDIYGVRRGDNAPIVVFIHGGGWRGLSKDESAFPAPTFIDAGMCYIALDFALLPTAPLTEVADQIRRAIAWIHGHADQFGGDRNSIHVVGHSSGAHLAAVMLTTEWSSLALPAGVVRTATCVSGMYDLYPVLLSSRRHYVTLTDVERDALSPILHVNRIAAPVLIMCGTEESPEFIRQSRAFSAALRSRPNTFVELAGVNHFGAASQLADASTAVSAAVLDHIRSNSVTGVLATGGG